MRRFSNDLKLFKEFQPSPRELVSKVIFICFLIIILTVLFHSLLGVFNEETKTVGINNDTADTQPSLVSGDLERYVKIQIVNNAIREIFLNQFAHMFSVYEYFFNQPNQVRD